MRPRSRRSERDLHKRLRLKPPSTGSATPVQASFGLTPAPKADFGIYIIKKPPLFVEELGTFLRTGFET